MVSIRKSLPISTWRDRWRNYWKRLSIRERRLLVVCSVVLLSTLAYLLIWKSYWETKARLATDIPELQKRLAAMQADEALVKTLKEGNRVVVIAPDKLSQTVAESLARAGLESMVEKVEAAGENQVSLTATQMPFAQWIRWVERLSREVGVSVTAATITSEGEGVVRVEATLAPMSTE